MSEQPNHKQPNPPGVGYPTPEEWDQIAQVLHDNTNAFLAEPVTRALLGDEMTDAVQALEDEKWARRQARRQGEAR